MFSLDKKFVLPIIKRLLPLIFNGHMFDFGYTLFVKVFGVLGTGSMDTYYVGAKLSYLFNDIVTGISKATAVMIGITLGLSDIEKAKHEGDYFVCMAATLSIFSFSIIFIFGCLRQLVGLFQLRDLLVVNQAIAVVEVFSLKMALRMFIVIIFSSLRVDGDFKILIVLDSELMCLIGLSLAFISVHLFQIQSIACVFMIYQLEQIVRVFWCEKV